MLIGRKRPIETIMRLLPEGLAEALLEKPMEGLEEIRVRAMRPVQLIYRTGERLLPIIADEALCTATVDALTEHSAFALERELAEGYFTVGACRVGICGRAVLEGGHVARFTDISGINIRIANQMTGVADPVMHELYGEHGTLKSVLVISAPGVGKTTLIRDCARQISDGARGRRPRKVAIADERGEIAGLSFGMPTLDCGTRTDVIDACPKAIAMRLLIRSMSPELIVTDEIAGEEDERAVRDAISSGVAVLASAHASTPREAAERRGVGELIRDGLFDTLLMLERRGGELDISAIHGAAFAKGERAIKRAVP